MAEKVALIGSRVGADTEQVIKFVNSLYGKYPDTILLSGGAEGVDQIAETTWLGLGGALISYRPVKIGDEQYVIEEWMLGGDQPRVRRMIEQPSFENYKSACLWRDHIISEEADRIVAFMSARWDQRRGSEFTVGWAEESQPKPRYRYYAQVPCE